jgi:hypothetical protein
MYQLAALVDAGVQLVTGMVFVLFSTLRLDVFLGSLVLCLRKWMLPSMTVSASSHLSRFTGACTSKASMIWPQRAK